MDFFEVRVKYPKVNGDGFSVSVNETYAVAAVTFTDAEARITGFLSDTAGDIFVSKETRAPYHEVIDCGGERFYLVKYALLEYGEAKVRRVPLHVLLQAESFDKAKEAAHDNMRGTMLDYEIISVKETDITEALL